MKKIIKIFMVLAVFTFVSVSLFAGGAKESTKSEFELTEAETNEGWRYFMPIGFKLHRPAFFDTYENNIDPQIHGEEFKDETAVVYNTYEYLFAADEVIEEYYKIIDDQNLSENEKWNKIDNEIVPKFKPIYALAVLRTNLIGEKKIEEITGYPINEVIRKTNEYTQVLCVQKFSAEGLSEKSAKIYEEMISQVLPIKESITCTDPIPPEALLTSIKNFKFEATDLEGKPVTQDIFKDYDVTMINIWATWCSPCRAELPEIAKLHQNFKDKKCNVIGICGDATADNQQAIKKAKKLASDAGCKYTIIQKNNSFDPLFKGLRGWPTTFFVDKNGSVISESFEDIIIGGLDLDGFTKAMEKALKTIKK